jgi:hypothetical protein
MPNIEVFAGKAAPKHVVLSTIKRLNISEDAVITDPNKLLFGNKVTVVVSGDGGLNLILNKINKREASSRLVVPVVGGTSNVTHRSLTYAKASTQLEQLRDEQDNGLSIYPGKINEETLFVTDACFGSGSESLGDSLRMLEAIGVRGDVRPPLAAALSTMAMAMRNYEDPGNSLFTLISGITHFGSKLLFPEQKIDDPKTLSKLSLKDADNTTAFIHLARAYISLGRGLLPDKLFSYDTGNEFELNVPSKNGLIVGDTTLLNTKNVTIKRSERPFRISAGV